MSVTTDLSVEAVYHDGDPLILRHELGSGETEDGTPIEISQCLSTNSVVIRYREKQIHYTMRALIDPAIAEIDRRTEVESREDTSEDT